MVQDRNTQTIEDPSIVSLSINEDVLSGDKNHCLRISVSGIWSYKSVFTFLYPSGTPEVYPFPRKRTQMRRPVYNTGLYNIIIRSDHDTP